MLRSLEQRTTILGIQRPFRAKPRFGTWRWGRFLSPFVLGPGGDSESPLQKPPGFFFPGLSALFYVCGPRLRRLPYPSRGEGRGPLRWGLRLLRLLRIRLATICGGLRAASLKALPWEQ